MSNLNIITKYFQLSDNQAKQFDALQTLYQDWNAKINVVSRADIDHLYERHILHSLAIEKYQLLNKAQKIVDVGTGGGFPGIPLAIMNPTKNFTLIDSIGKKISVVENIAKAIGLTNVVAIKTKSTMLNEKFDTIVSRAVTAFPNFIAQTKHLLTTNGRVVYLKGGDFEQEIASFGNKAKIFNIADIFNEEFFETKKIIELIV